MYSCDNCGKIVDYGDWWPIHWQDQIGLRWHLCSECVESLKAVELHWMETNALHNSGIPMGTKQ